MSKLTEVRQFSAPKSKSAVVAIALLVCCAMTALAETFPVTLRVDAAKTEGELTPVWRFFGADEPNYATAPNGRKLLGQLGALDPQTQVFFRTHNLLTSGDGTAALKWGSTGVYSEDARGKPIYNWTIVDGIFDAYLKAGVKPYVQLGFMPEALSVHPIPYRHHWKPGDPYSEIFTGWAYPPRDYAKWEELNYQWVKHCVEKYGRKEVAGWWWEVWNEPNISYWKGTPAEYQKLYDFAVAGVQKALPEARVGGPESTGPHDAKAAQFLRGFLEHCLRGTNYATGRMGTTLEFISYHAKGSPAFRDGHVVMGISHELQDLEAGFAVVAGFPELKHTPIVIGECDPDGCAACSEDFYPQNAYRDGALYASYTAASFARAQELAVRRGVRLEGTLTWAFEFEGQPWFAGFRALASNGVELPVLNAFRMMAMMRGQKVSVENSQGRGLDHVLKLGVRADPDVGAMASRDGDKVWVLVWHYHDEDVPGPDAKVKIEVDHLKSDATKIKLRHYRVDASHSNAYAAWKKMGSPQPPSPAQVTELERRAGLEELAGNGVLDVKNGAATIEFELPRQGVSLLVIGDDPAPVKKESFGKKLWRKVKFW